MAGVGGDVGRGLLSGKVPGLQSMRPCVQTTKVHLMPDPELSVYNPNSPAETQGAEGGESLQSVISYPGIQSGKTTTACLN